MKKQEINERVAKLCGWKYDRSPGLWRNENKPDSNEPEDNMENAPNYAESLDACLDFEKEYTFGEREEVFDGLVERLGVIDAVFASPLQRCEAFLRLKGQWK